MHRAILNSLHDYGVCHRETAKRSFPSRIKRAIRNSNTTNNKRMKPTILLMALAASLSSSMVGAGADAAVATTSQESYFSAKVRKAAAAGVPAGERKLQSTACYQYHAQIGYVQVPCTPVNHCIPLSCCDDKELCYTAGVDNCGNYPGGFEVVSNIHTDDHTGCNTTWVYSCCYGF